MVRLRLVGSVQNGTDGCTKLMKTRLLKNLVKRKKWEKPHQENLTGSAAAYAPSGSMRSLKAHKNKDYEPWNPQ
jgi:NADH:ubiquinone oxidoreductase subunit